MHKSEKKRPKRGRGEVKERSRRGQGGNCRILGPSWRPRGRGLRIEKKNTEVEDLTRLAIAMAQRIFIFYIYILYLRRGLRDHP